MAIMGGTIIVTGATGRLGSKTAVAIAKENPMAHLLLTTTDISSSSMLDLARRIRSIGPRSFEFVTLDLARYASVTSFASQTVERVRHKQITPISAVVNCAEVTSPSKDAPTEDGFDPVYQINCLSPFLLTVSLLEACKCQSNGSPGTTVVLVGSSKISKGNPDFFSHDDPVEVAKSGSRAAEKKAIERVGSSKLLMYASMYALKQSLEIVGNIHIDVKTVDSGFDMMATKRSETSRAFSSLGKLLVKGHIRAVNLAAKNIARAIGAPNGDETKERGSHMKLQKSYGSGNFLRILGDDESKNRILQQTMRDVGFEVGELGLTV